MSDTTSHDNDELKQALQRARANSIRTSTGSGPGRTTLALGGAVLVGAGFLGGYLVGGHGGGGDQAAQGGFTRRMDGPGGGPNGRPMNLTIGTITSISGNVVTLKSDSGDTLKVKIAGRTDVRVTKKGSIKDLSRGDNIVVHGQRSGDTITADDVNAGGMFRRFGSGGPGGASGPGGPADG